MVWRAPSTYGSVFIKRFHAVSNTLKTFNMKFKYATSYLCVNKKYSFGDSFTFLHQLCLPG